MSEDFKTAFRESAGEFLLEMEDALLQLNKNPDDISEIDRLFRVMHTIKGTSAMVDFDDVAKFAHTLEGECDFLRQGQAKVTPDIIHLALCAHDCFATLFESHYGGDPADPEHLNYVLKSFAEARKAATVKGASENYGADKTSSLLTSILGDLANYPKTANHIPLLSSAGKKLTQLYFFLLIQNKESIVEFISQLESLYRQVRIEKFDLNQEIVTLSVEIINEASSMFNEVECCDEGDFDPIKIMLAMQRPLELNCSLHALLEKLPRKNTLPVVFRSLRVRVVANERGPGALVGPYRFEKLFQHVGEQVFMQTHKKETESAL